MSLKEIKIRMLEWRDFYGGDIIYKSEIEAATTAEELSDIMDKYIVHLETMATDAQSHCEQFKRELGLDMMGLEGNT